MVGALKFSCEAGEVSMTADAREYWRLIYDQLEEKAHPAAVAALLARQSTYTLIFAALLALLNGHREIDTDHLSAAEAWIDYWEETVLFVFSNGEQNEHALRMTTTERMTFVQAAIRDGDQRTATAVLGAPAYLSGIETETQSVLTQMYHEHHEPLKTKRLKAAKAGLDLVETKGGMVHTQLAKAIGCIEERNDRGFVTRRIYAKELKTQKAAAEKAFVL